MSAQEPSVCFPGEPIAVSAVMPCLNEVRTLASCIGKAQRAIEVLGVMGEVIVADNGSTDGSVALAESLGARVVHQPVRGYGAALAAGITAARGRHVVLADADDSYDWAELGRFVTALDGGLDVVIGNRFQGGIDPGAMPPLHRYLGNPVLSWLARRVYAMPIGDYHCGMRALRRDCWPALQTRTTGMEFATEFIVNAAQAGLRIGEVPVRLAKDGRDRPPHLRSFRDGWRHLRFILTYGPNHLFLGPGVLMLLVGLAMVAVLAAGPVTVGGRYFGIHYLALGSLMALLGWNVLQLGLLAKVITVRGPSRLSSWLRRRFTLERGLACGAVPALIGLVVDARILWRYLADPPSSMAASVHPAFAATLLLVLGVSLMFSSFLLWLLLSEQAPASATANPGHPSGRLAPPGSAAP